MDFISWTSLQQCVKHARLIYFLVSYLPAWSVIVLSVVLLHISFKLDVYSQHESLLSVAVSSSALSPCLLTCTVFLVTWFSLYFLNYLAVSGPSCGDGLQGAASVVAACGLSCSVACASSLTKDPCPLRWQRILIHCTTGSPHFLF